MESHLDDPYVKDALYQGRHVLSIFICRHRHCYLRSLSVLNTSPFRRIMSTVSSSSSTKTASSWDRGSNIATIASSTVSTRTCSSVRSKPASSLCSFPKRDDLKAHHLEFNPQRIRFETDYCYLGSSEDMISYYPATIDGDLE